MDERIFLLQFSHILSEVHCMKIWEFFFQPPLVLCYAVPDSVPPRLAALTVVTTKGFWDLTQCLLLPQGCVFLDDYDPSEYDPFFRRRAESAGGCEEVWSPPLTRRKLTERVTDVLLGAALEEHLLVLLTHSYCIQGCLNMVFTRNTVWIYTKPSFWGTVARAGGSLFSSFQIHCGSTGGVLSKEGWRAPRQAQCVLCRRK